MRILLCTPFLAFWGLCVFAQEPRCADNRALAAIGRAMPDLAPGLLPVKAESSSFTGSGRLPAAANRNVIERAIRALSSRIFPARARFQGAAGSPQFTRSTPVHGAFGAGGLGFLDGRRRATVPGCP